MIVGHDESAIVMSRFGYDMGMSTALAAASKNPVGSMMSGFPTYTEPEQRYTKLVLEHVNGNKTKAAQILGTSATTLWRRLKGKEPEI